MRRIVGDFPELYNGAARALGQHYLPAYQKFADEMGLQRQDLYLVQMAVTFDPEPISDARLRIRFPYVAEGAYDEELAATAGRGFLEADGGGNYRLTEAGHLLGRRLLELGEAIAQRFERPPR
jgi:hypothetical protein